MDPVKFKSRYKPHAPRKFSFATIGESWTQQQHKEECDINNILAKYKKTGLVTHLAKNAPINADFTTVDDYQTSMQKIINAQESFMSLPSEIRSKFNNDPGELINYLNDEKNHEDAIAHGLMVRRETPEKMQDAFENALAKNDEKRQNNQNKK